MPVQGGLVPFQRPITSRGLPSNAPSPPAASPPTPHHLPGRFDGAAAAHNVREITLEAVGE